MKIGSRSLTASLFKAQTTTAFKAILPITLKMKELNGNEKYASLSIHFHLLHFGKQVAMH